MAYLGRRPKLDEQQMLELAQWAAFGRTQGEVAKRFGVRKRVISNYLCGSNKRFNAIRSKLNGGRG